MILSCGGASATPAQTSRAAGVDSGLVFTFTVTSNSKDSVAQRLWNSEAVVQLHRGEVRMDYTRGTLLLCCTEFRVNRNPAFGLPWPASDVSGYVLVADNARLLLTVNTERHRAAAYDAYSFATGFFSERDGGVARGGTFRFTDMGSEENILGLSTRRVQVVQHFVTERSHQSPFWYPATHDDTSDIWVTRDFRVDAASAETWARSFGLGGYFNNPLLRDSTESYIQQFGCSGVPLRIVTRSTVRTEGEGEGVRVDTIRAEVKGIRREPIDHSLFRLTQRTATQSGISIVSVSSDAKTKWERYVNTPPTAVRCRGPIKE